ncbi:MAG TPA: hypothetical protein DEP18_04020 [Flavobacteriales bacterium]|nr:hypothetical protein [Flavobacteriales bacterium]HCA82930.1 hypothetical protein [Flavobacteriales bacterium]
MELCIMSKSIQIDRAIGNYLRVLRATKNLSQENLADELKLSVAAYSNLERGKTEFTIGRIMQIARIFKIDWKELIDAAIQGNDQKKNPLYHLEEEVKQLREEMSAIRNSINKTTPRPYKKKK